MTGDGNNGDSETFRKKSIAELSGVVVTAEAPNGYLGQFDELGTPYPDLMDSSRYNPDQK